MPTRQSNGLFPLSISLRDPLANLPSLWMARLPPLVRVYQNNMLLHIGAQLRLHDRLHPTKPGAGAPAPHPSPPTKKAALPPPPKQHASCSAEIAALCVEIEDLRKELAWVPEHPHPPSPCTILASVLKPPQPHPSSPTSSSLTSIRSGMAHPDHPWLQVVLDHASCPPFIRSIDSSMSPFFVTGGGSVPEDVQQVVQLLSSTGPTSYYIGVDSNGDLQVARKAPAAIVHSALAMPRDWRITTHPDPPPPPDRSAVLAPTYPHLVYSALSSQGWLIATHLA